jgi:molecular chaperone Hsp33
MDTQSSPGRDEVRRFIIENRPVRGHWVHLEGAWQELRAHRDYPVPVRELLGQAVAASVLLAATLKFQGQLTLQLQGNGAVSLLVAQCTHDYKLRAVARFDESAVSALPAGAFRQLVGTEGRIAVTVEANERGARYQGIVPLAGESLADSLEAYFVSSEQLPTRVLLAADGERGGGVLVQQLPQEKATEESQMREVWDQAQRGIERLSSEDLLECPVEELLGRGFAEQDMRLFRGAKVAFECRCSHGRVTSLLRALGVDEVRSILVEQGAVTVTCEFCHRAYRFDDEAVAALFSHETAAGSSPLIQ